MKRILTIVFIVLFFILGSAILFAHMILDFLWLYEQGFVHTIMRLFAYRWLMIPFFGLVVGLVFLVYLFLFSSATQRTKKHFAAKTIFVILFGMFYEYLTSTGQGVLYAVLAGWSDSTVALVNVSVYLFWFPLIEKIALFGMVIFGLNALMSIFSKSIDKWSLTFFLFSSALFLTVFRLGSIISGVSGAYLGFLDFYAGFIPFVIVLLLSGIFLLFIVWFLDIRKRSTLITGSVFGILIFFTAFIIPWYLKVFVYNPNKSTFQISFAGLYADSTRTAFELDQIKRGDRYVVESDQINTVLENNFWNDADHFVQSVRNRQEILPIFNMHNASPLVLQSNNVGKPFFIADRNLTENKADDWDIKHFRNIFGYGAVIGSASDFDEQGFPVLLLKNLTMDASLSGFSVKNPPIFFGDTYSNFVFINTDMLIPDFSKNNAPLEKQNFPDVKGIPVNPFTKIILAIVYGDHRFLLTDYFNKESRLIRYRSPSDVVKRILPMFKYDKPRLILQDEELWWVLDGYSLSDSLFPAKKISTPWGQYNWVRSPIRAYVSAYSGEMRFEITDFDDPHAKIAQKLFPGLFKELHRFDAAHKIYPKLLFDIQSSLLSDFHVLDAANFYSGLNKWEISKSQILQAKEPVTHLFLHQENKIAYQRTYTPYQKNIVTARLLGYVDADGKKHLFLYEIPQDLEVPGLAQAEAFLNQDQNFSALATLWDQIGSKVSRSDTVFYPLREGGVYVQTVFLESENIRIPLATRFAAIDSLDILLYKSVDEIMENSILINNSQNNKQKTPLQVMRSVVIEAYQYFLNAQNAKLQGDTQGFSKNVDKIGETLQKADL